jgi:hypothetical protein
LVCGAAGSGKTLLATELFIRLDHAIKSVKAQRVVLDTIEALFAGFANLAVLRIELARLFHGGDPGRAARGPVLNHR